MFYPLALRDGRREGSRRATGKFHLGFARTGGHGSVPKGYEIQVTLQRHKPSLTSVLRKERGKAKWKAVTLKKTPFFLSRRAKKKECSPKVAACFSSLRGEGQKPNSRFHIDSLPPFLFFGPSGKTDASESPILYAFSIGARET